MVTTKEAKRANVFGVRVDILLTGDDTGGAYSSYEVTAEPGRGPLPHVHNWDDEAFYVLAGEFEIVLGEQVTRVGEGTFVYLPRNVPHTFKCVG